MQESFSHLRALLDYASNYPGNESSVYGAVSFILTLFCTSARVTATKFKNLHLASFPQKDLRMSKEKKEFRAPDFTILIVQSGFGQQFTQGKIEDMGPLIWEVKATGNSAHLTWFGEGRDEQPDMGYLFMPHFHQIASQVTYAKARFNQKPIYVLLSNNIWFILLHFPGNPPSVMRNSSKRCKARLRPADLSKFNNYVVVGPTPLVNEDCTAFSPQFLYALQLSVENLTNVTVTPHPFFRAPEGTAEVVCAQVCHIHLSPLLNIE
jgi:hypothetical protein